MTITILKGHTSPETAYVVDDYPYGFRLRCKIRYWLDVHKKHGVRLMSQTTNPKVPGERWNKPKASTYSRFGGAMFLDDNGHVHWSGLSEYDPHDNVPGWIETYGEGNVIPKVTEAWLKATIAYAERKAKAAAEG